MMLISVLETKENHEKAIDIKTGMFRTETSFNIGSIGISAVLAVLYILFW
jgi:SSS family solute:Na+ symporter